MSASISGSNITLTRGDTLYLTVLMTKNGVSYTPVEGEKVRFAMKKKIDDEEPLILKDIPIDTMTLKLVPEDTKTLKYGSYKYDIEYTSVDGDVDTFIGPANFNITEEVY